MQLTMYLGNDLIEAVPVSDTEISKPGYLGSFKRTLKQKYQSLIQQADMPPEFLVVRLSATNYSRNQSAILSTIQFTL